MRIRIVILSIMLLASFLTSCKSAATPTPAPAQPTAEPYGAPVEIILPTTLPYSPPVEVTQLPDPYIPPALPTPVPVESAAEPAPTQPAPTSAPADDPNAAPILPGEVLGAFTITTAAEGEATFGWDGDCTELPRVEGDATVRYACALSTAQKFNPCSAAYNFGSGMTLDEVWAAFKYELKINGRPVDLAAFGTLDVSHPQIGPMRIYNVVIVTDQPGEIVIEDLTTMPGQPTIATTATITFAAP